MDSRLVSNGLLVLATLVPGIARAAVPAGTETAPGPPLSYRLADTAAALPRFAVTGGFGNGYVGVGALGELYFARSRMSVTLGLGVLPDAWAGAYFGFSGSVRGYLSSRPHRAYAEVVVANVSGYEPGSFYGPGLLIGYSSIAVSGFTFNIAGGAGRRLDGTIGPALNVGLGFTWRQHR